MKQAPLPRGQAPSPNPLCARLSRAALMAAGSQCCGLYHPPRSPNRAKTGPVASRSPAPSRCSGRAGPGPSPGFEAWAGKREAPSGEERSLSHRVAKSGHSVCVPSAETDVGGIILDGRSLAVLPLAARLLLPEAVVSGTLLYNTLRPPGWEATPGPSHLTDGETEAGNGEVACRGVGGSRSGEHN